MTIERIIWGFTASREISESVRSIMSNKLLIMSRKINRQAAVEFVTGASSGGDAFIGEWLAWHWGSLAYHTIVVPANRSHVDEWWTKMPLSYRKWFNVIEMPAGTDYKYRNQFMVDRSTDYAGFPIRSEARSPRSGTWQTIRMATRAEILRSVTITGEE
jgi:hypothetical protein